MFTFLGILLILVGFGAWGLLFTGVLTELPFDVPMDHNTLMIALVGVGLLGVVFMIMGRRPAD
jgi:FtsH-binding integral membrane protein